MIPTALTLALVVLNADPTTPPMRNPIAPSLPVLTKEQEARVHQTIERFILADIGVLKGEEAKAATLSFESLGMESVPYLIDGLNQAAGMNQSCPVLTLGRKLHRLLSATEDQELLDYAVDNIGAGVGRTQYARALDDLRFQARMRKNYLARQGLTVLREMLKDENPEMRRAAVAAALEQRPPLGADLIDALSDAQPEVRAVARKALVKLNAGKDLGPDGADPTPSEIEAAQQRWRAWWAKVR